MIYNVYIISYHILWSWSSAISLPSRVGCLGNLSSFKIDIKLWCECCSSQDQFPCVEPLYFINICPTMLRKNVVSFQLLNTVSCDWWDCSSCQMWPCYQKCIGGTSASLTMQHPAFSHWVGNQYCLRNWLQETNYSKELHLEEAFWKYNLFIKWIKPKWYKYFTNEFFSLTRGKESKYWN